MGEPNSKVLFKIVRRLLSVSTTIAFATGYASAQVSVYSEQGKLFRAPDAITTLGANLFGDKVNLYTGGLEFVQTDVSLPGNNSLPVSVGATVAHRHRARQPYLVWWLGSRDSAPARHVLTSAQVVLFNWSVAGRALLVVRRAANGWRKLRFVFDLGRNGVLERQFPLRAWHL